jgi:hypothetical protein
MTMRVKAQLAVWHWQNQFRYWWESIKDWCARVYYCHHNARVIADFEHRMAVVLCEVTRGMSKPYYTIDAMLSEIADKQQQDSDFWYAEGRKDALEEFSASADADRPKAVTP